MAVKAFAGVRRRPCIAWVFRACEHANGNDRIAVAQRTKFDLSEYLPYLLNRVGMAMIARFSGDALARHGLTISMWRVLAALSHAGAQRQIDVSDLTSIDASTLSRIITRLSRKGLVTRERSTTSNREVTVGLTAKAQRMLLELLPIARDLEREALVGMTSAEVETARRLLRRMYMNLAEAQNPATDSPQALVSRVAV